MRIFSLLILLVVASALQSQVVVNENVKHSKYAFPLVASKIKATVCYDANDYPVVKKVAELFVSDIENSQLGIDSIRTRTEIKIGR